VIAYLDTSALVKLYVAENHSADVLRAVRRARQVATCRVAYPEARAALARRCREGGLDKPGLRRAVVALERDIESFVIVEIGAQLARRAGQLAEQHALRGFDAIHLAAALELGQLLADSPEFFTFDQRQARAAAAEGFIV